MREEVGNELCGMLKCVLHRQTWDGTGNEELAEACKALAARHKVLPLLYDIYPDDPAVTALCRQTVCQSYHLLFLGSYVIGLLDERHIDSILLKGSATAEYYPVPELRKSGDIDLLLRDEAAVEAACSWLQEYGFVRMEEQAAHHHVVCESPDHISVELHSALAEPFDDPKVNALLKRQQEQFFVHRMGQTLMGKPMPVLSYPYHAYYLLLHMLQHFLRAGFGLKLLCDWVCLWEQGCTDADADVFLQLVKKSGMEQFAVLVTAVCIKKLGLSAEPFPFWKTQLAAVKDAQLMEFLQEILEAEEFGHADETRMVVMRGTRIRDYMREFHHQMLLTYPRAGKCPLLYPLLWGMLLSGFLYRNKHVRGVSSREVLKKAKKRSRLVENLHLFQ